MGETSDIAVNTFRNLIRNMLAMMTKQRPRYKASAANTDAKSQSQAILANQLLNYYTSEKGLENTYKAAVESALLYGEGWVELEWDAEQGEVYDQHAKTGAAIREGDVRFESHEPYRVCRDIGKRKNTDHNWLILTSFVNKFELAAEFKKYEEEILASDDRESYESEEPNYPARATENEMESDQCVIYKMYHRPTKALPNGRLVHCLADGTVLLDSPLPYRNIPVHCISASDYKDTLFGLSLIHI